MVTHMVFQMYSPPPCKNLVAASAAKDAFGNAASAIQSALLNRV
jgi:hypothetical protein